MSHVHMDEVAAVYDETIPRHVQAHYLRKRVAFIRRRLASGRVADVGCGTGVLDEALRKASVDVVGLDESEGMLRHYHGRDEGLHGVCADSTRLPLASESVEAAVCIAVLHHVGSPEQVRRTIAEMLRIVKPGGWILLWDHNPLNPYWPLFMKRLPQDQEPTRLVPMRELREALRELGARRIEARRLGLVPDFAPAGWLPAFQALEWLAERLPGIRNFCAHNVVLAVKAAPSTRQHPLDDALAARRHVGTSARAS